MKKSFTPVRKILLTGLSIMIFNSLSVDHSWAGSRVSEATVFSKKANGETLRELLDQLGQTAGYSIEISTNWEHIRITVPSNIVKFEEGVKVILKSAGIKNYAIINDETHKKLTINVVGSSASSGIQNSPMKATNQGENQIEGSTFSQDEIPAAPPEEMLKGGEQEEPVSIDDNPISLPSADVINQHHGTTTASNGGSVAPPPEEVIRQHHGQSSVPGENAKIPPPSKEVLMQR